MQARMARMGLLGVIAGGMIATVSAAEPPTKQLHPTSTVGEEEALASTEPVLTTPGSAALDRRALIGAVLERNRELAAARHAVEAARARADKVRGLPDLAASYTFGPLSVFESGARYGQVIQVGQSLPWPGTLERRGEQAESLATAGEGELEALRRELALAASQGFDDYRYLERALAINREHLELMQQFQQVATARYAAGIAPQQAPLAAEVEIAHIEHREVVLSAERQTLIARLNALLHRSPNAILPAPEESSTLAMPPEIYEQDLIDRALETRPEIAAARSRITSRQIGVELARLEGKPDFRPMASFNSMWNANAHRWMVGLGLSLPVWRQRIHAGIAEADSAVVAERARLEALQDRIAAEVSTAVERLEESRHVVSLFGNRLLPAARDQVRAAQSGFETGQVDFLASIDAERNLRDVELGLVAAEADVHRRLAALQQAVGALPGDPWPVSNDQVSARRTPTQTSERTPRTENDS